MMCAAGANAQEYPSGPLRIVGPRATFQHLLWATVPGARLPDDPATPDPADWYSPDEQAVLGVDTRELPVIATPQGRA